jgi:hypothetical protein
VRGYLDGGSSSRRLVGRLGTKVLGSWGQRDRSLPFAICHRTFSNFTLSSGSPRFLRVIKRMSGLQTAQKIQPELPRLLGDRSGYATALRQVPATLKGQFLYCPDHPVSCLAHDSASVRMRCSAAINLLSFGRLRTTAIRDRTSPADPRAIAMND